MTDIEMFELWVSSALTRYCSKGYGINAVRPSRQDLLGSLHPEGLVTAVRCDSPGASGFIVVRRCPWEESIVGRPIGRVVFFAAETLDVAHTLAAKAVDAAAKAGLVLLTASLGNSPAYVHIGVAKAGFHMAAQAFTLKGRIAEVLPKAQRIPLRGTFRAAGMKDAQAVAGIAQSAFSEARYVADPLFVREWGERIYGQWAHNLVCGDTASVIVCERSDGIAGFASVVAPGSKVPPLLAVAPEHIGDGIGPMLVRRMVEAYAELGVESVCWGTEKSNVAMNSIYLGLGFNIVDSDVVYHWTNPSISVHTPSPSLSCSPLALD